MLDLVLQSAELFLLPPVIEGRDEDNNKDSDEDGDAFNPPGLRLRIVAAG